MKIELAKLILEDMAKHNKQGVTMLRLAQEIDIKVYHLRQLIDNYPDLFLKVGNEAKYTINGFGKYKGNIDNMLVALKKENRKRKKDNQLFFIIGISLLVIFMANTIIFQVIS